MQEKERVRYGKGGLEPQKQRFGSTKVKVWHCETSTKVIRVGRYEHLRRSIRASASVGADDKSREYEEEKRWGEKGKEEREAEEREVQAWGKRGAWEVCQNSLILKKSQRRCVKTPLF